MDLRALASGVIERYLDPVPFLVEDSLESQGLSSHDIAEIEDEIQIQLEKTYPCARIIKINSSLNLDYIVKVIEQAI